MVITGTLPRTGDDALDTVRLAVVAICGGALLLGSARRWPPHSVLTSSGVRLASGSPLPSPPVTREEPLTAERLHRPDPLPRRPSAARTLAEIPILLVIAAIIAFAVKSLLAQAFYIPSGSMLPQLQINDRVVVSKLAYKVHDPRRGDIIVFDDPRTGIARRPSPSARAPSACCDPSARPWASSNPRPTSSSSGSSVCRARRSRVVMVTSMSTASSCSSPTSKTR